MCIVLVFVSTFSNKEIKHLQRMVTWKVEMYHVDLQTISLYLPHISGVVLFGAAV